ncbi:MAG TPA: hypothetical protein VI564_03860 [Candidatus Nanoarchaeia archaeon]|nr:hypothetical protein [Candidatus Nanoarchaeia archaeon]
MNSLQDSNAKSDVSEREAKSQKGGIQEIVNEVYTANREFFLGVKNIYVSKEDLNFLASPNISGCSANVLGAYYNGTIIIKDSGDNTNRHTLLHELAHNAWKILSEERKSEWENIFLKSSSFVTPYAKYSKEEDFAESFACYFEDYEGCINPIEKEKLDFISDIGSNEMKKS